MPEVGFTDEDVLGLGNTAEVDDGCNGDMGGDGDNDGV